jgi:hypothetical protein
VGPIKRLLVREVTGPTCLSPDKGHKVFRLLQPDVAAGHVVELDFTGVDLFATPFFNLSIGQLLRGLDPALVRSQVRVLNLNEVGQDTFDRAWSNAVQHYHGRQSQRPGA